MNVCSCRELQQDAICDRDFGEAIGSEVLKEKKETYELAKGDRYREQAEARKPLRASANPF